MLIDRVINKSKWRPGNLNRDILYPAGEAKHIEIIVTAKEIIKLLRKYRGSSGTCSHISFV